MAALPNGQKELFPGSLGKAMVFRRTCDRNAQHYQKEVGIEYNKLAWMKKPLRELLK